MEGNEGNYSEPWSSWVVKMSKPGFRDLKPFIPKSILASLEGEKGWETYYNVVPKPNCMLKFGVEEAGEIA